ncbi:MAG: hypothetical protein IJ662_03045 [Clostridia bacterium]|nr:hypothetical protein [Clostridia bacterium]
MRARILLLPGSAQGEAQCACAEQLLTDISAAFDHSFSLIRGKLGPDISEKTIEECESSQGILLGDADCAGAAALYDALDMPLRIRSLCVPEALCARHESPVRLWLGRVLSLDDGTLRAAMSGAFHFAREEDARLLHVAPAGAIRADWTAAVRAQGAATPVISVDAIDAPDAVSALIRNPGRLGLMLCPPYAGSILEAAATALCAHPEMIFDFAEDESIGIYTPHVPAPEEGAADQAPPFAMALAVSRMLRVSLRLSREAACLDAAIQNVLANSYLMRRGGQENERSSLDLICEQIAVAGELMGKGGIKP